MATTSLTTSAVFNIGVKTHSKKRQNKRLIDYLQLQEARTSLPIESLASIPILCRIPRLYRRRQQANQKSAKTYRHSLSEFISDEEQHRVAQMHHQINQRLGVGAGLIGITAVGTLFYWPLNVAALPFVFYNSIPLHKKNYEGLKQGQVTMETLMVMSEIGAILAGYLWIATISNFLYQVSQKLILLTTDDSRQRLVNVFRQTPESVWVLVDGVEVQVPFTNLQKGDIVVVGAGDVIPADGTITQGLATVDQHVLTGEARPLEKEGGDSVFASTFITAGQVYIEVEKTGQETAAAKIGHILNQTLEFKSTQQLRAENIANQTVTPTIVLSALSLFVVQPVNAIAILNAHFKNKLSILAPISILNYLHQAHQKGVLIKDGRSLDLLHKIDTLVFDKTGTLTIEQPHIGKIYTCSSYSEVEILRLTATAESKQTHPIAKAILEEAEKRQLDISTLQDSDYKIGYGLMVKLDEATIQVGSHRFMESSNILIPPMIQQAEDESHTLGHSLIMIARNNQLIGAIELVPTIRPEAREVIRQLRQQGNLKEIYIISGDHTIPTKKLSQDLGIDHYFAETLPEDKADIIEQLCHEGRFVCYVGDGINDTIALKKSHVSISLGGASTVAMDTAQIILLDRGLSHLPYLFDLVKNYNRNMERSFSILSLSTLMGIGGALFWGFRPDAAIAANWAGFIIGLSNSMLPLFRPLEN
ncbi:MAG: heavy metal translocating P-type ATPase [Chloroflexota bacterium]